MTVSRSSEQYQHYPKLKKYISLFPPEVRQHSQREEASDKGKEKEVEAEKARSEAQREEIRSEIRERMKAGELSSAPELDSYQPGTTRGIEVEKQSVHLQKPRSQPAPDIREDAFFGDDIDEGGDSGMSEEEANDD